MYTFDFIYADGKHQIFEHITSITVQTAMGKEVVQSEQIMSYNFIIGLGMCLKSEFQNITVSGQGLLAIKITKE